MTPLLPRERFLKEPLVGGRREIESIVEAVNLGQCCRFIGPRYNHKSQIMREACAQVNKRLGFPSIYISMWDARTNSEASFYMSVRDLIASKVYRYYQKRLPKQPISSPADWTMFLASLPSLLRSNVVLFVDDLEATPRSYLSELLSALRAAYQTSGSGLRFLTVICSSHSLARVALGPTSPFENISSLITVHDLTPQETDELARQLLKPSGALPTAGALELILQQTNGDRTLVSEVCRECCQTIHTRKQTRLTRDAVRTAIDSLVLHSGREVLTEGLQQIESDPGLLRAIMLLITHDRVFPAKLWFDPTIRPDPLLTSGFVKIIQGQYRIKSTLHERLLTRHFKAEHVGHIFLASGDWDEAIYYLGSNIRQTKTSTPEERSQVMLAAVNAMYSAQKKTVAYTYLALGLETAYPDVKVSLYDLDQGENALVNVYHSSAQTGGANVLRISLTALHRMEIRSLSAQQEYLLQSGNRRRLILYIPVRSSGEHTLGIAIISNLVTQQDFLRKQDQIMELVGYVRYAARALNNRAGYESLYDTVAQRAKDLSQLLNVSQGLMTGKRSYQEILAQILTSALRLVNRHAQMGSIYLYDRSTGSLVMKADGGYPPSVRQAAKFQPGYGLAGHVYKTGRLWNVRNTGTDRYYIPLPSISRFKARSAIGVPLIGRYGNPLGVLCLDNLKRPEAFDTQSEHILTLFAGQVALWLENAHLLEVLRDLNALMERLDQPVLDVRTVAEMLAKQLLFSFGVTGCAIGLSNETEQIYFVVHEGLPYLTEVNNVSEMPPRLRDEVLNAGQLLSIVDLSGKSEWWRFLGQTEFSSIIALPIRNKSRQRGLLLLASMGEFDPIEEEIDLLNAFVNQLAIALERIDLLQEVRQSFGNRTGHRVVYVGNSRHLIEQGAREIHSNEPNWLMPDQLSSQIVNLLNALFSEATQLWVRGKTKGLSGSIVLQIRPTLPSGIGQSRIVKIGRVDKTKAEERNYKTSVEHFLPAHHATQINAEYSQDLGALLYTLSDIEFDDVLTFETFYAKSPADKIVAALHQLFSDTCQLWYRGRKAPGQESLRDLYLEVFNLQHQPNRLANEIVSFRPDFQPSLATISFSKLKITLPNPLFWLLNDDPTVMPICHSITHGDLNATNILMNMKDECWLIDFFRTYDSHVLRDFVVLETDIKFRLMGEISMKKFYSLEEMLVHLSNPDQDIQINDQLPDFAQKAARVIVGLRAEAWRLLRSINENNVGQIQREYLIGLMMATLNVLRLRHFREDSLLQPRRELALLSAAMICKRLSNEK